MPGAGQGAAASTLANPGKPGNEPTVECALVSRGPKLSKAAILVVTADAPQGQEIKSRLLDLGYKVAGPVSSISQLRLELKQTIPDLAFIDLELGGERDAFELAAELRESASILFFARQVDSSRLELLKNFGGAEVLLRPLLAQQLTVSIELALGRRRPAAESDDMDRQFLDSLLESFPNSVYVTDRDGLLLRANRVLLDWIGVTWEQAAGRPLAELFPLELHFRLANEEAWKRNRRVETEGATNLPSGPRNFRAIKFPLPGGDRPVQALGTLIIDLTSFKHAEQALRNNEEKQRLIAELTSDYAYTCSVDADGRIELEGVSDGFSRVTGYDLDELLANGGWAALIHPDDVPQTARLQQVILSGERIEQELRIITKAGATKWIRYSARPMWDRTRGRIHQLLGAVQDITRSKEYEAQLQAYASRLEIMSRRLIDVQEAERRYLARELHDEIGQILTAVNITLQSVKDQVGSPARTKIEESLRIVQQAIDRVRSMSLDLRPSILDDFGLVSALRWLANRQAQLAGFDLELDVPEALASSKRLPSELETACFRVVQEALTNVVRHAQAKNVRIQLTRGEDHLQLRIDDDGAGFDREDIEAKSERFGLLSMRERVQLLNGEFQVRSARGRGTSVEVRLPLENQAAGSLGSP